MTPKTWFLCYPCVEKIRYSLRLKELPSAEAWKDKHKCDLCGKTAIGAVYRVEDKNERSDKNV